MSQFPSPYSPPSVCFADAAGPDALSAAPRRAGMLMLILGALVLLMGVHNVITTLVVPAQQLLDQERGFFAGSKVFTLPSADQLHRWAIGMGIAIIVVGLLMLTLGIAVRRGNSMATGLALAMTSLLLLMFGIVTMVLLLAGLVEPAALPMVLLPGVPMLLMGWQLAWLISASRSAGTLEKTRQGVADEYDRFQQLAAVGGAGSSGGGYGYAAAPELPQPSDPRWWSQPLQPSDSERGK